MTPPFLGNLFQGRKNEWLLRIWPFPRLLSKAHLMKMHNGDAGWNSVSAEKFPVLLILLKPVRVADPGIWSGGRTWILSQTQTVTLKKHLTFGLFTERAWFWKAIFTLGQAELKWFPFSTRRSLGMQSLLFCSEKVGNQQNPQHKVEKPCGF